MTSRKASTGQQWGLCPVCAAPLQLTDSLVGPHLDSDSAQCAGSGREVTLLVPPPWRSRPVVCPDCGVATTVHTETGVCADHTDKAGQRCARSGRSLVDAKPAAVKRKLSAAKLARAKRKKERQAARRAARAAEAPKARKNRRWGSESVRTVSGGLPGLGKRR